LRKGLFHLLFVALLTIVTQVGGVIYLFALLIRGRFRFGRLQLLFLFGSIYLVFTFTVIPLSASLTGRKPLPLSGDLRPLNFMTVLLNRHYVNEDLKKVIIKVNSDFAEKYPESSLNYLDANFPFWDGFPLFPHLSHDDGKKLDLAFQYKEQHTGIASRAPSIIGYGVYEAPKSGEDDYPEICERKGYWQYGLLGHLIPNSGQYIVDEDRTIFLINQLIRQEKISKIFIEPHLKRRWGFENESKIRFHGCQAVRHDDHIHLQIN
jgi:hypothetical protein